MAKKPVSIIPDQDGFVRANKGRTVERAADFASLYANDVQVQTSPWDVRLVFGQIDSLPRTPDQAAEAVAVKLVGEVRLSPQLAKRVTMILVEHLHSYESQFGPIGLPKEP